MTELAFGALVVAAVAWTLGNIDIARGAASSWRIAFFVFLAIAAILFLLAVLGVDVSTGYPVGTPPTPGRFSSGHPAAFPDGTPLAAKGGWSSPSPSALPPARTEAGFVPGRAQS